VQSRPPLRRAASILIASFAIAHVIGNANPVRAEQFTDPARVPAAIEAAKSKAQSSGITYSMGGPFTVQGNAGGTVWRTADGDGFILHAKTPTGWVMYVPNTPDTNPSGRADTQLTLAALGKKPGGLLVVGPEEESDVQINDPWRGLTGLTDAEYTTDSAGRLTAVDVSGERVFEVKSWSGPLAKLPAENQIVSLEDQARMQLMLMVVSMESTELDAVYREAVADPRFKGRPVEILQEKLRDNGWYFQATKTGAVVEGVSAAGMGWRAVISAKGSKRSRGVKLTITAPAPLPDAALNDPGETFAGIDVTNWTLGALVNPLFPKPTKASVLDWIATGVQGAVESADPLIMNPTAGGRLSALVVTEGAGWRVRIARSLDGYCGAFVMTDKNLRPILTAPAAPGNVTREGTCA